MTVSIQDQQKVIAAQEKCDGSEYCGDDRCEECCEHGDYDHGICGNCGKDCTDDLVGAAEAFYYEGDR